MSRRPSPRTRRHVAGLVVASATVMGAAACGDFQLAEFTRATTTTVEVEVADPVLDPVAEDEGPQVTVHICAVRHVVEPGESLSSIAERCGVTVAQILEMNGISNANAITSGQQIIIPDPDAPIPPPWQQDPDGPGD